MRLEDVLRYALGAVGGYRTRSLLMVAAMAIGVAAVLILTSLGEGARRYVAREFSSLGTHLLIVFPGRTETTGGPPPIVGETPRDVTLDDALALMRSRAVERVAPVTVGTATVSAGRRNREALVVGSTADFFRVRHLQLAQGRPFSEADPRRALPVCVIGETVRQELFGSKPVLGEWLRVGDRRFRVIGALASRGQSLGMKLDEIVVIPVASAQMLFNAPSLFRILVEARSREDIAAAKQDILDILRERHEGEEDVTVVTQDSVLATFDRILRALTFTVAGIAGISLLVAGILIMNVMLVAVSQRTAEIGLLKALGARAGNILLLFLSEATTLSAAGALLGLGAGGAGSWIIGRVYPTLPVGPPGWAVAAAFGVAIATGLVFGVLPARRAARLDPVQALAPR
jgi:putative ABC transport system permease protein